MNNTSQEWTQKIQSLESHNTMFYANIWHERFYRLATNQGEEIVPVSTLIKPINPSKDGLTTEFANDIELTPEFADYIEGTEVYEATLESGWLARLDTSGQMDQGTIYCGDDRIDAISILLAEAGSSFDDPFVFDWERCLLETLIKALDEPAHANDYEQIEEILDCYVD